MDNHQTPSANPHHSAHPVEHQSHRAEYISIFLILSFLTFLELYVPSVYGAEWSGTTKMLLLCILAFTKAALVFYYFMHMKDETKWVRWIGYTPIYMGMAVIIIMLETSYR
jgi:cytochrome c oxidase subunit 4